MKFARSLMLSAAVALCATTAHAQYTGGEVKIGVLSDMSSLYADTGGPGSVVAAQLAVKDFDPAKHGMKVEIVSADHQNKPDVGASIARKWFDEDGVDMIADVPNSGVALSVANVVREKNKVFLISGAASSDLTGKACSPNTVHWTYDTWMLAHGTGNAIVKKGGTSWYFITADYAFGHQLESDTAAVVKADGGQVLGAARAPLNTPDFSSFLLQAQASKAKVIGLANAGGDTINSIKQASEFGITQGGQSLAALLIFVTDIHSIGLKTAQGLLFTTAWYWDQDDASRAWTKRFTAQRNGMHPTMGHAGVYASVLHYLKAVAALKSDANGKAVVDEMKKLPTDDPLFGKGTVRADGRVIHPAYLMQVKTPQESKGEWDLEKVIQKIPADQAFRPLNEGECPLVKG